MSGQREATEARSVLDSLDSVMTHGQASRRTDYDAVKQLRDGVQRVLDLPFSEFDPDDERSIWEADAYNAALTAVRAALLGES